MADKIRYAQIKREGIPNPLSRSPHAIRMHGLYHPRAVADACIGERVGIKSVTKCRRRCVRSNRIGRTNKKTTERWSFFIGR